MVKHLFGNLGVQVGTRALHCLSSEKVENDILYELFICTFSPEFENTVPLSENLFVVYPSFLIALILLTYVFITQPHSRTSIISFVTADIHICASITRTYSFGYFVLFFFRKNFFFKSSEKES
jgi:hypothetical protein